MIALEKRKPGSTVNKRTNRFNIRLIYFLLPVILLILTGCSSKQNVQEQSVNDTTYIRYAKGFEITNLSSGIVKVTVKKPYPGAIRPLVYLLAPGSVTIPSDTIGTLIRTPIKKIICTSTTHIPLLDYLDRTDALIGFPGLNYISSPAMRKRIDKGEVTELGIDKNMNLERLVMLQPDLVMAYMVAADFGQFKKIEELGIPVVINNEYLEPHPLGRAEWIKFMAVFFNLQDKADSVFHFIEKEYINSSKLINHTASRPLVMSGMMYRDTWFAPGGKNYGAQLLADAGCQYVWSDNDSEEFIELSYEAVLEKAAAADLWIGAGGFSSLEEMERADKRYTRFRPFQNQQVYTYNARKGPAGGNEYLELGYLRPDIILKDLIKIAHPEVLPDHALYFYDRLK